jgi:hypothetical protein
MYILLILGPPKKRTADFHVGEKGAWPGRIRREPGQYDPSKAAVTRTTGWDSLFYPLVFFVRILIGSSFHWVTGSIRA